MRDGLVINPRRIRATDTTAEVKKLIEKSQENRKIT